MFIKLKEWIICTLLIPRVVNPVPQMVRLSYHSSIIWVRRSLPFTLMLLLVTWCVLQSTTSLQCWYLTKEVFELWCPKDKRREPDGALVFTWRTLEPFTGYYWPSVIEPDLIDTWSKHLPAHTDLYTFRKDFIRLKPGAWHLQKMHRDKWFSLVNRKLYMSR